MLDDWEEEESHHIYQHFSSWRTDKLRGLDSCHSKPTRKIEIFAFLKKKILWKTPLWHCPEEVWLFVSYPSALKAPSSFFAISPFSSQTYFLFNQIITVFKHLLTWFARILGPVSEVSRPLAETNSRQAKALIGSIGI